LQAAIDAVADAPGLTFIARDDGRPYSTWGFGDWFREQCRAAGIPDGFTPHGLRKATATRIAEAEATAPELMSFGGWSSLTQAEAYIREANRKKMAEAATRKLAEVATLPTAKPARKKRTTTGRKPVNPPPKGFTIRGLGP
jgi:integrase